MPDPVKDLPDPLEDQSQSAPADPDELVARLADEAIDKLIADAEAGESPSLPPPAIDEPVKEPFDVSPDELDQLSAPSAVPVDEIPAPAADESTDAGSEDLQSQLDTLFSQLHDDPAPPGSLPMPPPVDVPADIAGLDSAEIDAADVTRIDHAGADVAKSDNPSEPPSNADELPTMQTDVQALLDDAVHHAPRSAPAFIVKPLEWLNAPFANLSDDTRDKLGQIAIVTLINALAVILYVILFGRPG